MILAIFMSAVSTSYRSSLALENCVGRKGGKEGEFDVPRGLTLRDNLVYVCDCDNHRIQVFDLDLNFVRSIGSCGSGRGEFDRPLDVKFDAAGNMYVVDWGNERVQVMDSSGRFIREFGRGKLSGPSGLLIADKYVYVSDFSGPCIVVYETSGQYVTSFGRPGLNEGEFNSPYCITSCVDGFIHVCDLRNDRVQIFLVLSTLFTIMIMTSSVITSYQYYMWTVIQMSLYTTLLFSYCNLYCALHNDDNNMSKCSGVD